MPENEIWNPRSRAAAATSQVSVKQCMTPPASQARSSRMIASVSSAAERVWITSGLLRFPRRANVRAKALALPFEVAFQPVVVEPRLTDSDDLAAPRLATSRRPMARAVSV